MSDATTHLLLPYILAAQAQKHVTHNEALRLLDGLVQLSVLDRDLTAPPGSPADGDRYIVASGATGDWAGWDLNVALWTDGAWLRLPPRTGWRAWVEDEGLLLVYDGAGWIGTTPAALQNLALLGLGTGVVSFALATGVAAVTIAVAWFAVRPALALALLAVAAAAFFVPACFAKSSSARAAATAGAATAAAGAAAAGSDVGQEQGQPLLARGPSAAASASAGNKRD